MQMLQTGGKKMRKQKKNEELFNTQLLTNIYNCIYSTKGNHASNFWLDVLWRNFLFSFSPENSRYQSK